MLTPPASDKALAAGGVLLANSEKYVPNWPLTCGWTLRRWLVSHRELVVRFIRAWVAATDWLLREENRESTLQLMMEKENLNRASAAEAYRKVVPKARINPGLEYRYRAEKRNGVYKPPYDPRNGFTMSYWREATGL
jgi:ABC-type nitrate/sulfonate/bicarbonate transport system substrate-binding protein